MIEEDKPTLLGCYVRIAFLFFITKFITSPFYLQITNMKTKQTKI